MLGRKKDLPLTLIVLPSLYPSGDITNQISLPAQTACCNIAPPLGSLRHVQIDAFEHCTVENKSLLSIIPENTKTVFINSINLWALYCGVSTVYRELLHITSTDRRVFGVLISGALDKESEDTLLLLADVIIRLTPRSELELSGTYTETIRQSSGRTESNIQHYSLHNLGDSFKLNLSKIVDKSCPEPENAPCDVTFELGLSEKEKNARAATELPYMASQTTETTGSILYVPDEQDDWDDEDPDDDLDI